MSRLGLLNLGALLAALAGTLALGARGASLRDAAPARSSSESLRDATGVAVPVAPYARVVSASTVADQVLVESRVKGRVIDDRDGFAVFGRVCVCMALDDYVGDDAELVR